MTSKTLLFALIFGAVCAAGCSSTSRVNLDSPDADETLRAINEGAQQRPAKVEYADRQRVAARSLLVAPDTTSWLAGAGDGMRIMTPTHDLQRIQFNRRGQGAMEGLALGALAGVATSFGMLLSGQEFKDATRGIQLLIPLGSLAGIVFGAIRGNRRTYVFRPAPLPDRLPPLIAEEQPVVQESPPVIEEPPVAQEQPVAEEPPPVTQEPPVAEEEPVAEEAAPAAPLIPFDRTQVSWTVVVASYPERAAAEADAAQFREQLRSTDYPVDVLMDAGQYRVVVGQFETLMEAQTAQQGLGADVSGSAWLLYFQPVTDGEPDPEEEDSHFGAAVEEPSSAKEPPDTEATPVAEASRAAEAVRVVEAARAAETTRLAETTRIADTVRAIQQPSQNMASLHAVVIPPVQAAPTAQPDRVEGAQALWTVVVASYPEQASAEAAAAQYRDRLSRTGYPVAVVAEGDQHSVVVGHFRKLTLAQVALQSLTAYGAEGAWLMNAQNAAESAFAVLESASAAASEEFDSVITLRDILLSPKQPAPAVQPDYSETLRSYWTVVVASHSEQAPAEADAAHYRDRLGETRYPVDVVHGSERHRVVVGQFETLSAAKAAWQDITTTIPDDAWLLNVQTVGSEIDFQEPASVSSPAVAEASVVEETPVIEEPSVAEEATPAVQRVRLDRASSHWTVVVASYPEQAPAETDAARYRERFGEVDYPIDVVVEGGQHRVVVGHFQKLTQAQSALQGLATDDAEGAWLLYFQPKQ